MRFLAVDVNAVFRRMWEAAEGKDFGAARQRSVKAVQEAADGYDRIVACRDVPPSFRKVTFAGYKASRSDPGEAFRDQLRSFVGDLQELGASIWVSPPLMMVDKQRYFGEADDVIASFALWYQERRQPDWHLRILTGDHDLWALVDDELAIDVLTLDRKKIDNAAVVAEYGCDPQSIPEVKALEGDPSDEYRGFQGIGRSTAVAILNSSLERHETDRSAADAVFRALAAGLEPGCKLKSNQLEALKSGGAELLRLGRMLAYMRPQLVQRPDGTSDTLDFSPVLGEPVRAPRRPAKEPALVPPPAAADAPDAAASTASVVASSPALALARTDGLPFAPQLKKMMTFAGEMFDSGIFRATLPNPASCLMVCEYARAFRVPAVILAQHTNVIKGKMGFGAQVIMAIILAHPSTKAFRFTGDLNSAETQTIKYHRSYEDGEDESGVYAFTIEMARRAEYLDGQHSKEWKRRPSVMLGWAAARECARKVWPDVTVGIYGPDEHRDHGMTDGQGDFPEEMTVDAEPA